MKALISKITDNALNELVVDGTVYTGVPLADKFNSHFISAGATQHVQSAYPRTYITQEMSSVFLSPVTPHEIEGITRSLKENCASGYDDIAVCPVKALSDVLCAPLAHICDGILTQSGFPEKMKIGRVWAVHKSGARDRLGNYRPISVLPIFSKIAEYVINRRLNDFYTRGA